jgi:hypothetical protein
MDQFVKVRLDEGETRRVKTERRVRQGYCLSPILFNLYSEYLTKKTPEVFEEFRIRRQIISIVKSADDFVLMAKEETVVPDRFDRLIAIGLYCEMEINVDEAEAKKISI